MNNEEKFKQSLKSLVDSKEFAFDDKDWEKAAAYIGKKRAGGKAARIGLLIFALGTLIGTSVYLFSPDSTEKQLAAQESSAKAPVANNATESPLSAQAKEIGNNVTRVATSPKIDNNTSEVKAPTVKSKTGFISRNNTDPAEKSTPEKIDQEGSFNLILSKKDKARQDKNTSTTDAPSVAVTSTPEVKEETGAGSNEEVPVAVISEAGSKETLTDRNEENKQEAVSDVETPSLTPVVTENKKDVPDEIKAKVPRVMLLSCEIGTSYQPGWKNDGADRDADGFNPVAGIHYLNPINEKLTLSFGIQYQRTGHLDAFSHTSKQSRYSFGEESEVTTITPSKLHYLSVPIRMYYKLNDKNIIGGAYSIGYLLDVEANVETYTLKVGKQSNNKSYTTRGYTDGFTLFDSQVALFYRRHLFKDFSVHGEFFFGLSDVKQDNFFGGDKAQRNSGIRLMLVYGIHSRNK